MGIGHLTAYVSIRQHAPEEEETSMGIGQHTAYVSIRQHAPEEEETSIDKAYSAVVKHVYK
jgi:hypothetical protein